MLEQFYSLDRAIGIAIELQSDDSAVFNVCEVYVNKRLLDLGKKRAGLSDIAVLKKEFPQQPYCALNICGKGVLHKQLPKIDHIDKTNFSRILPNANMDDFYIQQFNTDTLSFISVIRKQQADKWLQILTEQGYRPLMLSLGSFAANNIENQLNLYEDQLVFDGHVIQRDDNHNWLSYHYDMHQRTSYPLKIAGENIDERLILPYAAAFQLVLSSKLVPIKATVSTLGEVFSGVINDRKLKVKAVAALGVFFILLFFNFILFSWLTKANNQMMDKVSRTTANSSELRMIETEANQKESLVKQLGWDGSVNKSLLVDQLAALLPSEVKWRELTINKLDWSASKIQKKLVFLDRQIRVTGESDKIIPVNEWLARVKSLKWVKSVQLDSYLFNAEQNTGQFIVVINY